MSPSIPAISTAQLDTPSSVDTPSELVGQSIVAVAARNSAFVLGAQMVIKVLAFLFNVCIVRRLGAVHFGQYSSVMAYVTIFGIFTNLGLAPYSVREMAEDRRRASRLVPNAIVVRLLLSLVVICTVPLLAYWLGKEHRIVLGILNASAGQLLYAFQGPLDSALTAWEWLDYVAVFSIVNQLIFWGMGFIGLIVASLLGVAAAHLGIDKSMARRWCKTGRVTARRVGLRVQVSRDDVEQLMQVRVSGGTVEGSTEAEM